MPIDVKKYIDVDSQDTPIIVYRDKMPVLDTLNVTPDTVAQEIVPETGVDGFNKVNVSAVNASIDSNIVAENIKAGVNILGVDGNLDTESFGMTADAWGGSGVDDYGRIVYTGQHTPNFRGVRVIDNGQFYRKFFGRTDIVGLVDFRDLENVADSGMMMAFDGAAIKGVNLASLKVVTSLQALYRAFAGTQIESYNLDNLEEIRAVYGFYGVFSSSDVRSAYFPKLKILSGANCFASAFYGCSSCGYAQFPELETITGAGALQSAFAYTKITRLEFPSLRDFGNATNYFNGMLVGVSGCLVRFPSNLESIIGDWSDVQNGFGGTDTTVLFDLPATE